MKKFLCLLLMSLLLVSACFAESEDMREFYNPENYPLLKVTDAFVTDDGQYVVQGSFGDIDYTEEWDAKWYGFDEEKVFTLVIADNAEIEMPTSIYDEDNVPATPADVVAYCDEMRAEGYEVYFYSEFELDRDGKLTKLCYCYMPY